MQILHQLQRHVTAIMPTITIIQHKLAVRFLGDLFMKILNYSFKFTNSYNINSKPCLCK